ncbi:MAG: Hpt domain-containing protein [Rhodobacteraceae bacterium]|nr:Hpt domain-containing protein [Paracoccaceae bacterium]
MDSSGTLGSALDRAVLESLFAMGDESLRRALGAQLREDFLRLRGALASDIAHEIGRAAHELKGLAATVGAGRLAQMARSVDDVAQGMAAPALAVIVVPLRAEVDAVIACLDDAIADTSRR